VGFEYRDVRVGSTARDGAAVLEVLHRTLKTWLSVLGSQGALPRGDFHSEKVVGAGCEPGNLWLGSRGVNGKIFYRADLRRA